MTDLATLQKLDDAALLAMAKEEEQRLSELLDKGELRRLFKCVSLAALLKLKLPPREPMLSPWLTEQSIAMLYAWRGIGKTWLALCIGYAVATGGEVLGWKAPRKYRVLQSRLALIVNSFPDEPLEDGFRILTPDLQPDGIMPNLSDQAGQEVIDAHTEGIDLIIVDNLSTMARSGKENEGESWLPVQGWALRHRAQGRAVLFIHHSGKSGQQRGASRREDVLDTVISLKRPAEYQPDAGARFEVHFEKARNLTGDDAAPLEVALHSEHDRIRWEWKSAENAVIERIADMVDDGANRQDIQTELGLSRFQLNRVVKTANETRVNKIVLPDSRKAGAK
ncbi:MAG: AAA family ATPase [Thiobacillaceae bacterium]